MVVLIAEGRYAGRLRPGGEDAMKNKYVANDGTYHNTYAEAVQHDQMTRRPRGEQRRVGGVFGVVLLLIGIGWFLYVLGVFGH